MSEEKLDAELKPFVKSAVKLEPHASESANAPCVESKFGGVPYAEEGDTWPICTGCGSELDFIAQLSEESEVSLHTFYYCFDCFPWGFNAAERGQWEIISYQNPLLKNHKLISRTTESETAVTPCVVSESPVKVLPDWESLQSIIPAASELCSSFEKDSEWDAYEAATIRQGCLDDYSTLIGGYPRFVQGEVQPSCDVCGKPMTFFAQIDSEDEANVMWGDVGLVYFFRCAEHKGEFHFELQCH